MKAKKEQILSEAIDLISKEDLIWCNDLLLKSTINCGYKKDYAYILFPNAVDDLVQYFIEDIDQKMLNNLQDKKDLRKHQIIREAILERLKIYEPIKNIVQKTINFLTNPCNLSLSSKLLFNSADKIWNFTGDDSIDLNYYSKRIILSSLLSSTILFWLNDESNNYQETIKFLDNRLSNILEFGKAKSKLKQFFTKIC